MKLSDFKKALLSAPEAKLKFVLPDGDVIEPHAHITEVGRIDKTFIDCGGKIWKKSTCLLQAWVADDVEHRFLPGKLVVVLEKAAPILGEDDLEMEIEYEDCAITQFTVGAVALADGVLTFQLGDKHTACLAQDVCLTGNAAGCC